MKQKYEQEKEYYQFNEGQENEKQHRCQGHGDQGFENKGDAGAGKGSSENHKRKLLRFL